MRRNRTFRILRRLGAQQGTSMLELAFLLPTLTMLLLGVLEFGRLLFAAIEVTDAARAGVAYGSRTLVTAMDTSGMQTAATNDAPDNISGTMVPTATTICQCSDGTATTCAKAASVCASPKHVLEYVQVKTVASIDPIFHVPGLPTKYTVKGSAIMRVQ
jgi:Flp pilus assembly protein TadG